MTWPILTMRLFLLVVAVDLLATGVVRAQVHSAVSLELALLVDVSASVDDDEYRLQTLGLATAFQSQRVRDAIRSLAGKGLALAVVQWANHESQKVAVDWTVVRGDADALRLSERIAAMPRLIEGGHTALGDALSFALAEMNSNGYTGARRVIDLSGDGRSNDGSPLSRARQEVLDNGITINGLAILNELPLLERYFQRHLIGGDGAFVMTASDYGDFARAITLKLEREIRSAPLAVKSRPFSIHMRSRNKV